MAKTQKTQAETQADNQRDSKIFDTQKEAHEYSKKIAKNQLAQIEKVETGTGDGVAYSSIERGKDNHGQQATASPEEIAQRQSELRTQGRKGCKAIRINMAITPENHNFIAVMSNITGQSMTQYINYVIEKYREEHGELYKQAQDIIKAVNDEK